MHTQSWCRPLVLLALILGVASVARADTWHAPLVLLAEAQAQYDPCRFDTLFGPEQATTLIYGGLPGGGNGGLQPVAGEVNGDGNVDLVWRREGLLDPTVDLVVALGDGAGNFSAGPRLAIGETPVHHVVADFDADGTLDIAAGPTPLETREPVLSYWPNDGQGDFGGLRHDVITRGSVSRLAVVDLDLDGKLDLVYTHSNPWSLGWIRNVADLPERDEEPIISGIPGSVRALAIARLDSFVPPSIVVAAVDNGALQLYRASRPSVEAPWAFDIQTVSGTASASQLVAADIDSDSFDERILARDEELRVTPPGSAVPTARIVTPWAASFAGTGDVNRDGLTDVAIRRLGFDACPVVGALVLGEPRNNLDVQLPIRMDARPGGFVMADVTADGIPDLVSTSRVRTSTQSSPSFPTESDQVRVWLGRGAPCAPQVLPRAFDAQTLGSIAQRLLREFPNPSAVLGFEGALAFLPIVAPINFGNLDADRSGSLTAPELARASSVPVHSADINADGTISLAEFLRVVQLFANGPYTCAAPNATEDGYDTVACDLVNCRRHSTDYRPPLFEIDLSELLRTIQIFVVGGYLHAPDDLDSEDGYQPVAS